MPHIVANWFKRSATLIADLASPLRLFADNQATIDRIAEAADFDLLIYDIFLDISRYGNAVLKVRFDPGRGGIVERIDPRYWFPVVSPDDARAVEAHVLAYDFSQFEDHVERRYLRVEEHRPGSIRNRLFRLDTGGKIVSEMPPAALERYSGMEAEEATGVSDFLIVPLAGLLRSDGVFGLDDFRGIEELVREIELRLSHVSSTLEKFSDPNMAGPESIVGIDPDTGEVIPNVIWSEGRRVPNPAATVTLGGGVYFPVGEGEPIPAYLTWDASLASNFSQIEEIKSELMAVAEISPALLGDTKNGLAESGSALKRLAIPTLAKVARLRMRARRPILQALRLVAELEVASRWPGAELLENLSIEWRSGLPADPVEAAQVEGARKTTGLTSTYSALARLDPDASDEDLQWELGEIKREKAEDALHFL